MGRGQKLLLVLMSIFLSQLGRTWGEEIIKCYYTSFYDVACSDGCEKRGYDYYWCNTKKGWDYCSPLENRDYEGLQCKDGHPCEKHDDSYYWCRTTAGSWGYCGKVETKPLLQLSSTYQNQNQNQKSENQSVCRDECLLYNNKDYFFCNTDEGWDYCSPLPDVTYKNEPCQSGHSCDTHSNSYTCKTASDWEFCGLIYPNECRYHTSSRKRRQLNNAELICTRTDIGNKIETRFYAEPAPTAIANGDEWRNEIENIISRWDNSYLGNQARSQLITTENLRIDLQGLFPRNNQRYYNLQIQVNRPRQSGTSTTLAQVLIPQNADVPSRYVRMAFIESSFKRARVSLEVNQCNTPRRTGQNG